MKKDEKINYTKILRIAQISVSIFIINSIITLIDIISNFKESLGIITQWLLIAFIPSIILLFFMFKGLSAIAYKKKLKSLRIIFWATFITFVVYEFIYLLLILFPKSIVISRFLLFAIFLIGITFIIFGFGFFQLRKNYGNLVSWIGTIYILSGISFLAVYSNPLILINEIFKIFAIILEILVAISYILLILIFNKAIKEK